MARSYLREALRISVEAQLPPNTLAALAEWVALLVKEREVTAQDGHGRAKVVQQTVELLAMILHHWVTWRFVQDKVKFLLVVLGTQIPPEESALMLERGRSRKLEEVVDEILRDFK